jgi:hypothetical protein
VIITAGAPGGQLCWSEPWMGFSARTGRCAQLRRSVCTVVAVGVHAVDVPSLQLPDGATPAFLGFNLFSHTLTRAVLVPVYEA